ncbi:hypothetical protein CLOM_g18340 [Closterium sp. NIES-68]|nr:hypothetical protein CLOM_g18340 [Closterium sp. NIES-68]GJP65822.1 hypothetical protein CLOP_g22737 [Closterium sp. NIES-67]
MMLRLTTGIHQLNLYLPTASSGFTTCPKSGCISSIAFGKAFLPCTSTCPCVITKSRLSTCFCTSTSTVFS